MRRRTARRTCLAFAAAALGNGAVVAWDVHAGHAWAVALAVTITAAHAWACGFFACAWIDAPPERRIVPLAPVERARQAEYEG